MTRSRLKYNQRVTKIKQCACGWLISSSEIIAWSCECPCIRQTTIYRSKSPLGGGGGGRHNQTMIILYLWLGFSHRLMNWCPSLVIINHEYLCVHLLRSLCYKCTFAWCPRITFYCLLIHFRTQDIWWWGCTGTNIFKSELDPAWTWRESIRKLWSEPGTCLKRGWGLLIDHKAGRNCWPRLLGV
jgi:hypothetical protein